VRRVLVHLPKWRVIFPRHLLRYYRFAAIVDGRAFARDFGFAPRYSIVETLASVRGAGAD
jgi:hypothetical protein